MEFENGLEEVQVDVSIVREKDDAKVELFLREIDSKVELTNSSTEDIKSLFDSIYEYIVNNKKMLQFNLNDSSQDLFYEVANDIIVQLNSEIKQSENDFIKIFKLEHQ
ncbi:hypothetical protein QUF15_08335 [Lactococcus lactis]|uniref:Uncharacterized protein n=2 Tax=Lactococcus lactis subsp. cremoris TaxID=1359 RepID=A0ABR5EGE0_LACLC|nr:hypothetical protein [Lactococcus lactis]KKW72458.1 hypothetical protein VN93_1396 [Lactococcus cremoris]MDM7510302.1 hypothetical protein [Lactococcus lactis]